MQRELTPSESLKLIETMIDQAKRSFSRISFFFLLWGVLLIGAMVATFLLRNTDGAWAHGAAFGIAGALGGLISAIAGARMGASTLVANPMDRVVGWIWLAFIITLILFIIATAGTGGGDPSVAITLLTGLPTFITGRIMRFKPLVLGGILFWVAGLVMAFSNSHLVSTWAYCTAMLFGYLIPGFLLKRQEDGLRTA